MGMTEARTSLAIAAIPTTKIPTTPELFDSFVASSSSIPSSKQCCLSSYISRTTRRQTNSIEYYNQCSQCNARSGKAMDDENQEVGERSVENDDQTSPLDAYFYELLEKCQLAPHLVSIVPDNAKIVLFDASRSSPSTSPSQSGVGKGGSSSSLSSKTTSLYSYYNHNATLQSPTLSKKLSRWETGSPSPSLHSSPDCILAALSSSSSSPPSSLDGLPAMPPPPSSSPFTIESDKALPRPQQATRRSSAETHRNRLIRSGNSRRRRSSGGNSTSSSSGTNDLLPRRMGDDEQRRTTMLDEKNMRGLEELEAAGLLLQHRQHRHHSSATSGSTSNDKSFDEEEAAYKLAMRRRKLIALSSRATSTTVSSSSTKGGEISLMMGLDVSPNMFPSRPPPMGEDAFIASSTKIHPSSSTTTSIPRPDLITRGGSSSSQSSTSTSGSNEGRHQYYQHSASSVLHEILCRSPDKSSTSRREEFARWAKQRLEGGGGDSDNDQQQQHRSTSTASTIPWFPSVASSAIGGTSGSGETSVCSSASSGSIRSKSSSTSSTKLEATNNALSEHSTSPSDYHIINNDTRNTSINIHSINWINKMELNASTPSTTTMDASSSNATPRLSTSSSSLHASDLWQDSSAFGVFEASYNDERQGDGGTGDNNIKIAREWMTTTPPLCRWNDSGSYNNSATFATATGSSSSSSSGSFNFNNDSTRKSSSALFLSPPTRRRPPPAPTRRSASLSDHIAETSLRSSRTTTTTTNTNNASSSSPRRFHDTDSITSSAASSRSASKSSVSVSIDSITCAVKQK